MITRSLLVLTYIWHCIRLAAKPWKFFQLNAGYFNNTKGIFSKLDMDQRIPARWKLAQYRDNGQVVPENFPVFLKPEWGQNSAGVVRADNIQALHENRASREGDDQPYLIQESARGSREFEVYLILSDTNKDQFATLSITEVTNTSGDDLPVNGIYNKQTCYQDISGSFSADQLQKLWSHLKQVGQFRTARFGIRADNLNELVSGEFKIFEINLFLPMPLALVSSNVTRLEKLAMVCRLTKQLAAVTRTLPEQRKVRSIFFRKLYGRNNVNQTSRTSYNKVETTEEVAL
ncbi:hypothetical protein [Endozoicomonas sp. OPT23]|uniref:hypothetical protein n=1 Tax=Endozoicomonas sp. OPT23 TaxID=2072845 RepID=UPI001891A787|nr:hypothetical protein [Endozoicomonas sp. OPT23]